MFGETQTNPENDRLNFVQLLQGSWLHPKNMAELESFFLE